MTTSRRWPVVLVAVLFLGGYVPAQGVKVKMGPPVVRLVDLREQDEGGKHAVIFCSRVSPAYAFVIWGDETGKKPAKVSAFGLNPVRFGRNPVYKVGPLPDDVLDQVRGGIARHAPSDLSRERETVRRGTESRREMGGENRAAPDQEGLHQVHGGGCPESWARDSKTIGQVAAPVFQLRSLGA